MFKFKIVEKLQHDIAEIAKEADPKKRLELAKKALSVDEALRELEEVDIRWLRKYHSSANVFVTYYDNTTSQEESDVYFKLAKLRLIGGYSAYSGESLDYITPIGQAILDKLDNSNP